MTYTTFDRNGRQLELDNYEYLAHLLLKTELELSDHLLIKIQFQNGIIPKKDIKFQNWYNRSKLRFLIYDFIEIKECKDIFFVKNHYIINEHIKLLTKALNCKHPICEHPLLYKRNNKTQYDNYCAI